MAHAITQPMLDAAMTYLPLAREIDGLAISREAHEAAVVLALQKALAARDASCPATDDGRPCDQPRGHAGEHQHTETYGSAIPSRGPITYRWTTSGDA